MYNAYDAILTLDPNNEEVARLRDMAAIERFSEQTYREILELTQQGECTIVYKKIKKLRPTSLYFERIQDESIVEQCHAAMLVRAERHLANSEWQEALDTVEELLALQPCEEIVERAEHVRTQATTEQKRADKNLKKEEAKKRKQRAESLYEEKCAPAVETGKSYRIIDACSNVLKYDKHHYPTVYELAKAYDDIKDYKNALKYYRRAHKVAPGKVKPTIKKRINYLEDAIQIRKLN